MAFLNATRQNKRKIFTMAYDSAQRVSQDLPATGLLANLYLRFRGTLTYDPGSGSIALKSAADSKPYGIYNRVQLTANSGTDIVNTTGYGLYLRNLMTDNAYLDILAANMVEAASGNPVYQFPTSYASAGSGTVEFTLKIPVVNNERDLAGLIMLQNRETLMTLTLDFAAVTDFLTLTGNATASLTGNVSVTMEYFSVPANKQDYPDLSIVHTLLEDRVPVDGTGDLQYTVPRGNIYMRMLHRVILNAAPAGYDDISRMVIQYNQSEQPYFIDGHDVLAQQRERYKRDLPKGVYAWDFSYQGQAGLGGARDLVNSRAITDFLSILTVDSGATLGTNNNYVQTVREQLVPLA